jgi:SAM-dependent methyltransferase
MNNETRLLDRADAKGLSPGGDHYSAYVGPPALYDVMGASQFRLLTTLGLRDRHRVLDFGCGSLRLGRLLLPYLLPEHYFGIEPNAWLVRDAIAAEVGEDQIRIKRPRFSDNDDFAVAHFGVAFDFIIAQSILSHCGADLVGKFLRNCGSSLSEGGIILVNIAHVGSMGLLRECARDGWAYPECVAYHPATILTAIDANGLSGLCLPWFHPTLSWYAIAKNAKYLPHPAKFAHLSGAILREREFMTSS